MAMKIVILEDDMRRMEAMRDWLVDRFYQFEILFFDSAFDLIDYLKYSTEEIIALSLDHDLLPKVSDDGQNCDPGTGRDVADYLATIRSFCSVVIHAANQFGAIGMESVLVEAGWQVCRVSPFDDLQWIHDTWYPAIRRAIVFFGTTEESDKKNPWCSPDGA
ncbi:cyclic-phosphate processing receiver domain-containing protein [Singulisphaera rosea]